MFKTKKSETRSGSDFSYLKSDTVYVDSACQSLRPKSVIDALNQYYYEFNSCGERVKYDWGKQVDAKIDHAREGILKLLGLSTKDHFVSFTLNTTYGLNLVLNQINPELYDVIITTDIEHNSVFLPTMTIAKRHGKKRVVVSRNQDGSLNLSDIEHKRPLLVLNAVSNIDGRSLKNISEVVSKVHSQGGIVVIDAAQAMAHNHDLLNKCQADAICFSAHKMYSSSLGVIIAKKSLVDTLETSFIGGGMVQSVEKESYKLADENHIHTILEPGLQAFGEIVAFGEALDWLPKALKNSQIHDLSKQVYDFLVDKKNVVLVNQEATPTISFYHKNIDSHLLAEGLSTEKIMARSGYFCCHYFLQQVNKYPALLRLSFGIHNTQSDVDKLLKVLDQALR